MRRRSSAGGEPAEAQRRKAVARESKSRISDIALQAGFSGISHFNRLFRSRFGDAPKGVRAPKGSTHAGRSKALITRPKRSRFSPRGLPY